ncbi:MAG: hypothetical protein M1818_003407 [Claussenomyces sp. TS43310]|nr:MAG: hypothetical protein M1818_003407 [Claussenomyces sp. TS43310]
MAAVRRFLGGVVLAWYHANIADALMDFSIVTANLSNWNQSDWSLTTDYYLPAQYQSRISLANGYVGASLAAAGPFFEVDVNQTDPSGTQPRNGWPLFDTRLSFSTISGFFDIQANETGTNYEWLEQDGWESIIAGIPHPTGIIFAFGDEVLDAKVSNTSISDFSSSLSFKTGVATWNYTWSPGRSPASFLVTFTAIFSRVRPNVIAVQASITPSQDVEGTVTDFLDGSSALRAYSAGKALGNGSTIVSAVHPEGLANITAYVVSTAAFDNGFADISSRSPASSNLGANETTIGQTFNTTLKAGQKAVFTKFVGVASNDKFPDPEVTATQASVTAQQDGWDRLFAEHVEAWGVLMTESAIDNFTDPVTGVLPKDSNVLDIQISSVANTYYLLQNVVPDGTGLNDNSIAVGGLSSDSYGGLIFWDADYWMAPGLNLAFPSLSKQISNFRVKQHPQALENAAMNGYPNGSSLYSWTAGKYGNCTGTGPCVDYEYHLNYDIAFNLLQQYNVTNNETWFDNGPKQIIRSTAIMTGHLLEYNATTRSYWLRNMTDPDEYANNVDNGAFTIASAATLLDIANRFRRGEGLPINETWAQQSAGIEFPRAASSITLEYQTMTDDVQVKQADVVLLTYPLDYTHSNYSIADKLLDLDYYADRQSPSGPAMTYSVFAINANALSPSGCAAYTYALGGTVTYLRAPWYQFSEQAVDDISLNGWQNPAFPFLTGHGGANQIVPFGFLGVRTDQAVLYINPSLPPQIPQVRIRDIYFAGAGLSSFMNQTHTTITRFDTSESIESVALVDKYTNTSMPIMVGTPGDTNSQVLHQINVNETITVPNRLYFNNLTYPHNLIQCLPVSSQSSYVPGQFPVAATDGSVATEWQPATTSSASIIVNMSNVAFQPVSGIYFNWGARPARNATVFLGNSTGVDSQGNKLPCGEEEEFVIMIDNIGVSLPYNASAPPLVEPYNGNSTTAVAITSSGGVLWSGDYARLEIEGCEENDGAGATVAEFVLIGISGALR